MSNYTNSDERGRLTAGLRELADFIDANPEIPAPWVADVIVLPPDGSNAEMFAGVDAIAARIGATASDADSPAGHYSTIRRFGPVQYRAVAVPRTDDDNGKG